MLFDFDAWLHRKMFRPPQCDPLAKIPPGKHALLVGGDGSGMSEVLITEAGRRIVAGEPLVHVDACGDIALYAKLFGLCDIAGRLDDLRVFNAASDHRNGHIRSHRLPPSQLPLPADLADWYAPLFSNDAEITLQVGNLVLAVMLPVLERVTTDLDALADIVLNEILVCAMRRQQASLPPMSVVLHGLLTPARIPVLDAFLDRMTDTGSSVIVGARNLCCSHTELSADFLKHFAVHLHMKGCDTVGQTIPHPGMALLNGKMVELPYREPPRAREITFFPPLTDAAV